MKVVAFSGSARKNGNTAILIGHVLEELRKEGIDTMKTLGRNMAWLLKKTAAKKKGPR